MDFPLSMNVLWLEACDLLYRTGPRNAMNPLWDFAERLFIARAKYNSILDALEGFPLSRGGVSAFQLAAF